MRKSLLLIGVLALSCASLAQSSWSNLSALQPGHKIQIVDTVSKKHSGTFVRVSETAILIRNASSDQSIQRQDIRSVKLENNHRLSHTVIGAAVGAGAGAGITAAAWEDRGFFGGKGVGAAVGATIGGISGAILGVLLPTHSTIYQASPH